MQGTVVPASVFINAVNYKDHQNISCSSPFLNTLYYRLACHCPVIKTSILFFCQPIFSPSFQIQIRPFESFFLLSLSILFSRVWALLSHERSYHLFGPSLSSQFHFTDPYLWLFLQLPTSLHVCFFQYFQHLFSLS